MHSLPPMESQASDYFRLIFEEGFSNILVEQSNLYAQQRLSEWRTDRNEIDAFIGLTILMGINQLPEYKLHWSNDVFLGNGGFKNTMPVKR